MALPATPTLSSFAIPSLMPIRSPPPPQTVLPQTATCHPHLRDFPYMSLPSILRPPVRSRTMVPPRTKHAPTDAPGLGRPNILPRLLTLPVPSIIVEPVPQPHHTKMLLPSYLGGSILACGMRLFRLLSQLHFISDQRERCTAQFVTRAHN